MVRINGGGNVPMGRIMGYRAGFGRQNAASSLFAQRRFLGLRTGNDRDLAFWERYEKRLTQAQQKAANKNDINRVATGLANNPNYVSSQDENGLITYKDSYGQVVGCIQLNEQGGVAAVRMYKGGQIVDYVDYDGDGRVDYSNAPKETKTDITSKDTTSKSSSTSKKHWWST